ncbi:MAG TPA: zf-HC2 domain-containing protein, partial [Ilumatobacteraceae bacterium]|nr:zf-HC2 domain-containing protein [Ilumatobacteraceae bacterium]
GCCGETVEVVHLHQSAGWVGNFATHPRHMSDMDCGAIRELLSAQLDQETTSEEEAMANTHLGRCAQCQVWWSEIGQVNRVLRVRLAETIPDLATGVLARAHPPTVGRRQWVRLSLAAVAAAELMLAAPGVLLGEGASTVHDARHLGSFGAAMSVGLIYVAWRPARAFGILPIVVALAVTMFVSTVVDVAQGRTTSLSEAHHVLEIAGLVLVWMLAGRPVPRRFRSLIHQPGDRHHFHHA